MAFLTGPNGFFSGLPRLARNPTIYYHDDIPAADVKEALDQASAAIRPLGGWTVVHCRRGSSRLHAKLLLVRFRGFLRVYVGSANFSDDRGVANGA